MDLDDDALSAARARAAALAAGDAERLAALLHEDTAVLLAEVADVVDGPDGAPETFRMPVTQTWVRIESGWRCLAGHAGPRRTDD